MPVTKLELIANVFNEAVLVLSEHGVCYTDLMTFHYQIGMFRFLAMAYTGNRLRTIHESNACTWWCGLCRLKCPKCKRSGPLYPLCLLCAAVANVHTQ